MAEHIGACAGVDVGGTFTDVVVHAAGHRPRAVKVPTTPDNQATTDGFADVLQIAAQGEPILSQPPGGWDQGKPAPERSREVGLGDQTVTARVISRAGLAAGDEVSGPALIEQSDTTTLLAADEVSVIDDAGNLVVHLHG